MIFGFICLLIGFYLGVAFMAIMSIAKEKKKGNYSEPPHKDLIGLT